LEIPLDDNIANLAGGESPYSTFEKEDAMTLVRKKLMELEPRDREVVILKIEHGRTYKEISEIMGLTVTNVGFILHTAIKKLAKAINSEK
jgi:RNA polymerase sigma-70 factor (ECF subfamily)